MRFLASIPELCDITFLVGETREPVCAVKAVLAARSRREKRGHNAHCRVEMSYGGSRIVVYGLLENIMSESVVTS